MLGPIKAFSTTTFASAPPWTMDAPTLQHVVSGVKYAAIGGVVYGVWRTLDFLVIQPLRSPLKNLPGPPVKGGLLGTNLLEVMG